MPVAELWELREAATRTDETDRVVRFELEGLDRNFVNTLAAKLGRFGLNTILEDPNTNEPVDEHDDLSDLTVRLTIAKRPPGQGRVDFIFPDDAAAWIKQNPKKWEATEILTVFLATEGGRTAAAEILTTADGARSTPAIAYTSPLRIVRHLSGGGDTPCSAASWIIHERPQGDDPIFSAIDEVAAQRLPLTLASELWREDGKLFASFKGGRQLRLDTSTDFGAAPSTQLIEAVKWVYAYEEDAETKHGLLAAEIAREWKTTESLNLGLHEILEHALQNAKTAFSIKIRKLSTDALKLMSDLRKNLSGDVQGAMAQSTALTSALWRDAAIALAVMLIRSASPQSPEWISVFAAIYLIISGALNFEQFRIGLQAITAGSGEFRSRVYGYLSDEDYKALYTIPFNNARATAEAQAKLVMGIYALAALLCFFAPV